MKTVDKVVVIFWKLSQVGLLRSGIWIWICCRWDGAVLTHGINCAGNSMKYLQVHLPKIKSTWL